jgi:hypothetical protein
MPNAAFLAESPSLPISYAHSGRPFAAHDTDGLRSTDVCDEAVAYVRDTLGIRAWFHPSPSDAETLCAAVHSMGTLCMS